MTRMVIIEVDGVEVTRRAFIAQKAAEGLTCPEIGRLLDELGCPINSATIHAFAQQAADRGGFVLKRATTRKSDRVELRLATGQATMRVELIDKHGKKYPTLVETATQHHQHQNACYPASRHRHPPGSRLALASRSRSGRPKLVSGALRESGRLARAASQKGVLPAPAPLAYRVPRCAPRILGSSGSCQGCTVLSELFSPGSKASKSKRTSKSTNRPVLLLLLLLLLLAL
jgi:hypothetical protein